MLSHQTQTTAYVVVVKMVESWQQAGDSGEDDPMSEGQAGGRVRTATPLPDSDHLYVESGCFVQMSRWFRCLPLSPINILIELIALELTVA